MTKDEFRFFIAGRFVMTLSRHNPIVWQLLDSYVAGAMAAYDYLNGVDEAGLKHALEKADENVRKYLTRNLSKDGTSD